MSGRGGKREERSVLEALLPLEGTSNLPILSRAGKAVAFPPSFMAFAHL